MLIVVAWCRRRSRIALAITVSPNTSSPLEPTERRAMNEPTSACKFEHSRQ